MLSNNLSHMLYWSWILIMWLIYWLALSSAFVYQLRIWCFQFISLHLDILLTQKRRKQFDVFKLYMDLFWMVDL